MIGRLRLLALTLLAMTVALSVPAYAQTYPSKLVKLIVPLTPGSPIDVLARLYSPPLSSALGQTVVIENRPGAGTTMGAKAVASAEPDGHTLLLASTSHPISAAMYPNLSYDPYLDFAAVAALATTPWVLVIETSVPAASLQELVAYAKANPGKLHFGFGVGTAPHIIGEAFKRMAGIDIASIPYKGGAQVVPDMLGGRIQINIGTPSTLLPLIRDGKLRALAVTGSERVRDLPAVPTMQESGYSGLPNANWAGILAPRGTPAAVAEKLSAALNGISRTPEMQASLAKLGFEAEIGSPGQFADFFASEKDKWEAAVKLSGVTVQ
jgi:tripartite-type tricarboxylate transporter receptor subunit TctC